MLLLSKVLRIAVLLGFIVALNAATTFSATTRVPQDYGTIQQAIDASSTGDTVLVSPGVHSGGIHVVDKKIAILATDSAHGAVITASGVNLVSFTGAASTGSILEGFRLSGGLIGVLCESAGPIIRRNILSGQNIHNWGAISLGGYGYATYGSSPAVIVNNTIVNCANGGISTFSTSAPTIKNNIIAFNSHYGIHRQGDDPIAQPLLSYNDIYGNPVPYQEIANPGTGTISTNPLINLATFMLDSLSPCINAGDPNSPYNDPDGSRNDIGAKPFVQSSQELQDTVRVPQEASSIGLAISMVSANGVVFVAPGTYHENLYLAGKALTLVSDSGAEKTKILPLTLAARPEPLDFDSTSNSRQGAELRASAQASASAPLITIPAGTFGLTVIKGFTLNGGGVTQGINCLQSNLSVTECILENCYGPYDGGALWIEHSDAEITNNIIRNNYTPISGAGVFVRLGTGHSPVLISGNTFYGNVGGNGPAISMIEGDNATITRNVAFANTAIPSSGRRGAIYIRGTNMKVSNNTSAGNTVGLTLLMSDQIDVRNNILSGNLEYGLQYLNGESPQNTNITADYNDSWNNSLGNYQMTGAAAHDISADPLFLSGYKLADGSPCIDAGDPDPMYNDPDLSRNDMGAIPGAHGPLVQSDTLRVPLDRPSIQAAVNDVTWGGTVLVAPGTYSERVTIGGKPVSIVSDSGAATTIISYPGFESAPELPQVPDTSGSAERGGQLRAIAEAASAGPMISIASNMGVVISGFTVDGGNSTQGINCLNSEITVSNCILQNCVGPYDGGAMWIQGSHATITGNTIRNNYTPISGAGVFVRLGTGHKSVLIDGNEFYGNVGGNGPAISLIEGDSAIITHNVVHGNTAIPSSGRRGGIYVRGTDIFVRNNTLAGNTVGLTLLMSNRIDVRNNIMVQNLEYGYQQLNGESPQNTNVTADYNDVWQNLIGNYFMTSASTNDLSADPMFLGGYQLADSSPCIDAGDPDPTYNDPDLSRNDIGAIPGAHGPQVVADTLYVPTDRPTIQEAVNDIGNGGYVIVMPGTYGGGISVAGKSVHLLASDTSHSAIITGTGINLVTFTGIEASSSTFEGFRLTGGMIGIWCQNSGPTIRKNILEGQQISNWGAISLGGNGYATVGTSPAIIINNTIVNCNNGGISTFSDAAPVIKNNIIAFNGHYGIHREGGMAGVVQPVLSYNDVYANPVPYQEIADPGIGTLAVDPLLDNTSRGLIANSPCIDAGDPATIYNDPDGSRNDMGAVPSGLPPAILLDTVRVPIDASTISSAIARVKDHGVVLVGPGVYTGEITMGGKPFSLISEQGAEYTTLKSSFSGLTSSPRIIDSAQGDRSSRVDLSASSPIDTISSGRDGAGVRAALAAQAFSPVITVSSNPGATITGFTIDGGNVTQGVNCLQSTLTLSNCTIKNCMGVYDGGAVWIQWSNATITNNVIHNNVTPISGAGLFIRLGYGHDPVVIDRNTFYQNEGGNGPAISLIEGDNAVVTRNVAYSNTAIPSSGRRGAVYVRGTQLSIRNNTLVQNTVGLTILMSSTIDARNNILTSNLEYGLQLLNNELPVNVNITSDYNDVWGNLMGEYYMTNAAAHDISADPAFSSGYMLSEGSPCINAGDPNPAFRDPDLSRNDMGAHYYSCCSGLRGNIDCDAQGNVDISDITRLIDYAYLSLNPLCCSSAADLDGDSVVDISDLSSLIDHLLISLMPLQSCLP